MATNKELVDGTQTLAEQEQALNFMEQMMFAKVINYAKDSSTASAAKNNEATLDDVPIGQQPPALHLSAIDAGGDVAGTIASQLKQGKTVVFHDVAFVEGQEKTVIGFR